MLYGYESWSLTLSEECRQRVFENRILRGIFGPKGDANGEWKRLHNEELHSLHRSANIVSRWEDNIRIDLKEIGIIGLIRLRIGIIGEPLRMRH